MVGKISYCVCPEQCFLRDYSLLARQVIKLVNSIGTMIILAAQPTNISQAIILTSHPAKYSCAGCVASLTDLAFAVRL